MSDYGADKNPDLNLATNLAFTQGFMPQKKTNVMQWTYPDDVTVRKLANKDGKSNALFKFAPPEPPGPIPPVLDPVPAGDACTVCWGNDKPFGVGETPESIIVVIQDVEKGPTWDIADGEPPNGTFELTQDPRNACVFRFIFDDHSMVYILAEPISVFNVASVPEGTFSFAGTGSTCSTFYTNRIRNEFINGTATIFIPPIAP